MADHIAPARPSRSGGSCSRRLPLHVCVALSARVTKAKKRGSSKSTNAIKNPAEFARFRSEDANNAAARCEGGVEAADRVDGAMGQPPSPRCSRAQQTCGPAWALPRSPPGSLPGTARPAEDRGGELRGSRLTRGPCGRAISAGCRQVCARASDSCRWVLPGTERIRIQRAWLAGPSGGAGSHAGLSEAATPAFPGGQPGQTAIVSVCPNPPLCPNFSPSRYSRVWDCVSLPRKMTAGRTRRRGARRLRSWLRYMHTCSGDRAGPICPPPGSPLTTPVQPHGSRRDLPRSRALADTLPAKFQRAHTQIHALARARTHARTRIPPCMNMTMHEHDHV